jgi:hypothetical protein
MFEGKGFRGSINYMCDVNRGVAEWLTGGDGMCQWKRLSSEGLQADIHNTVQGPQANELQWETS